MKRIMTVILCILYPREPHGIREFPHQSDRLRRIVSWFDKYIKK
jgi:dipeptidyl aminopeptidase/acylaminoacyl peptidase